jgi:hypothetical protein
VPALPMPMYSRTLSCSLEDRAGGSLCGSLQGGAVKWVHIGRLLKFKLALRLAI